MQTEQLCKLLELYQNKGRGLSTRKTSFTSYSTQQTVLLLIIRRRHFCCNSSSFILSPTDKFGAYSDQHGVRPSIRLSGPTNGYILGRYIVGALQRVCFIPSIMPN